VRILGNSSGRQLWPARGVYFLFEHAELRSLDSTTGRVVRVGTHAVSVNSRSTLWGRLRTHKGSEDGRGNHRGSILRLHVGMALKATLGRKISAPTWGIGTSADSEVRRSEENLERLVSEYLHEMAVLWLQVADEPVAERRSISCKMGHADPFRPRRALPARKLAGPKRYLGSVSISLVFGDAPSAHSGNASLQIFFHTSAIQCKDEAAVN